MRLVECNLKLLVSLTYLIYKVVSSIKHGNPINTGKLPLTITNQNLHAMHLEYENHPWYYYLSKESGYNELNKEYEHEHEHTNRKLNYPYYEQNTEERETLFKPIRITFDVTNLNDAENDADNNNNDNDNDNDNKENNSKKQRLLDEILPAISDYYTKALSVIPMTGIIIGDKLVNSTYFHDCFKDYNDLGGMIQTPDPWVYNNTDIVIFVTAQDNAIGHKVCSIEDNITLASATICSVDQFDRPIIGVINFCLDALDAYETSAVSSEYYSTTDAIEIGIHQIGHLLGMNSEMYKYFRNPSTGLPLTKRPFYNTTLTCASGKTLRNIILPSCNVIKRVDDTNEEAYEIVTPTVRRIARNLFNCHSLKGARLETNPINEYDCFGSHWYERFYYSELFSTYFTPQSDISPLTLAFFEDTGWYRANYNMSKIPTFGLYAGCDFLEKDCIDDNENVPDHSKGYFCNSEMTFEEKDTNENNNDTEFTLDVEDNSYMYHYTCDPTATFKATCDLTRLDESAKDQPHYVSYFNDKLLGPSVFTAANYCPMPINTPINCQGEEEDGERFFKDEVFGASSYCYEIKQDNIENEELELETDERKLDTNTNSNQKSTSSACFKSRCDEISHSIFVSAGGIEKKCSFDFELLQFKLDIVNDSGNDDGESWNVTCPRLSTICPQFSCPNLCSGRGDCLPDKNSNSSKLKCDCIGNPTADDREDEKSNDENKKNSNDDDDGEEDCSTFSFVFNALNETTCVSASYSIRPFFLNILPLFFGVLCVLHV